MSCTRLYVEYMEALICQARKKRLLRLLMELSENVRGNNSPNIVANTKETKLVLIEPFVWILGTLLSPYYRVFIIEVPPPLGLFLIPSYSSSNIWNITGTLLRKILVFHHSCPPPASQIISNSACVSSSP